MKVNLINKPQKVTIKDGERKGQVVEYDRFYLVADNGVAIAIEAGEGHSKTDEKMNKQIWAKNMTALRLLADRVAE